MQQPTMVSSRLAEQSMQLQKIPRYRGIQRFRRPLGNDEVEFVNESVDLHRGKEPEKWLEV